MRARGLEPPRAFAHRLLRPACLPVPPRPLSHPEPSRTRERRPRTGAERHLRRRVSTERQREPAPDQPAVLAVLLGIFALVAGPGWFARDKTGFEEPSLSAGLLGTLTLLIVPVQMLLVAFAMRGFSQGWNVEVERYEADPSARLYGDPPP